MEILQQIKEIIEKDELSDEMNSIINNKMALHFHLTDHGRFLNDKRKNEH